MFILYEKQTKKQEHKIDKIDINIYNNYKEFILNVFMGFSEHQDNLSMSHLERQDRKMVIEQKILQESKSATKQVYKEVLSSLRPDQIGTLIKKNYWNEKTQQYLPFAQIQKDYAYNFLVQTALTMLWKKEIAIDADYWAQTTSAVKAFQNAHWLNPDGKAWPAVLQKCVDLLLADTKPVAPIKLLKQKEVHSLHAQWPLSYEAYKEASDKQREKACFESLIQLWFSPVVAAWIVWNIYVESYDRRKSKKRFHTTSYGDWWKSFWLCQWNNNWANKTSWRLATLKKFAQSQWTPPDAYDTQLAFIKYELENTEQNAGKQLAGVKSVAQAAKIFMTQYERPRNRSSLKERQRKANEILQEYGWNVA